MLEKQPITVYAACFEIPRITPIYMRLGLNEYHQISGIRVKDRCITPFEFIVTVNGTETPLSFGDHLYLDPVYESAMFGFDIGPTWFGYTMGITWNGWACPLFPYDSAIAVNDYLSSDKLYSWSYDASTKTFTVIDSDYPDEHDTYTSEVITLPDGSTVEVWGIGNHNWTWNRFDDNDLTTDETPYILQVLNSAPEPTNDFDAIFTAPVNPPARNEIPCAVCSDPCLQLDHGVCVHCMLAASQALVTAADLWRDQVAKLWMNTYYLDRAYSPIDDLYYAVNAYVCSMIDWQSEYSCNVWNYTENGEF